MAEMLTRTHVECWLTPNKRPLARKRKTTVRGDSASYSWKNKGSRKDHDTATTPWLPPVFPVAIRRRCRLSPCSPVVHPNTLVRCHSQSCNVMHGTARCAPMQEQASGSSGEETPPLTNYETNLGHKINAGLQMFLTRCRLSSSEPRDR